MMHRLRTAAQPAAAIMPARGAGTLYRRVKLALAVVLIATGWVRCPCGGWDAILMGGAAGTALYALLARDFARFRPTLREFRPAFRAFRPTLRASRRAWDLVLTVAVDEVVWRGWLTSPGIGPALRSSLAVAICALFALAHFPRQGRRGVATHLVSGTVFTMTILRWGLAAAVAAHLSYNFWVLAARRARTGWRAVDLAQRARPRLVHGQQPSRGRLS